MLLKHCLALVLVCFMLCSCAGRRSDTYSMDHSLKGKGLDIIDIGTIAERMAPAILDTPEIEKASGVARISLLPVKNSTHQNINQGILLEELRTELNKYNSGKMIFLERDWVKESFKELIVSGVDFYLESELRATTKGYRSSRSDYNIMYFQLVDRKTNDIVWEASYEVKRVGMPGVTYPRNQHYEYY